ncbi:DUF1127 domain-containing protein [Pseudomonas sp. UBA2684]|uniref:DUF1127 domain-containing protein n=1 Tax=Pseudomonas sp. UBA2684 TaxID=1947311 RepID=UPI000E88F1B7|nr:DUF1127 domain-containing protein [Pseudomonas sp. UBA2684]HBX55212.1 hypothetical protein [Pseudomonas sp.]|tara:strand:+ start:217 stop:420 length:204 start_codon:yes stop_codon:yes gene_type:complete
MERSLSSPLTLNPPRTQWLARLPTILKRWQLNARTRRQLAALDERLLADAGISPSARFAELEKPFWR